MPRGSGRLPLWLVLLIALVLVVGRYGGWPPAKVPLPASSGVVSDDGAPGDTAPQDPTQVAASDAACARNLYQGAQPTLPDKMQRGLILVCYQGYASASSPLTRTPLWSAEHLTAQRVRLARGTERTSTFFAEPSLPYDVRGELPDYRRSGFDRGHLSPSGDMPGSEVQRQSFSLANIAPQVGDLNRGPWADLESRVRDLAQQAGDIWVVTGVLFEGAQVNTTPDGRVMVPTVFWKAVMVPGRGAIVFVAPNDASGTIDRVTLPDFARRSGITPFPRLAADSQTHALEMD